MNAIETADWHGESPHLQYGEDVKHVQSGPRRRNCSPGSTRGHHARGARNRRRHPQPASRYSRRGQPVRHDARLLAEVIGRPNLADHPDWVRPENRLPKLDKVFALIEDWSERHTKWGALDALSTPLRSCAFHQGTNRRRNTQRSRGDRHRRAPRARRLRPSALRYGCLTSQSRSTPLGEHTDEICAELGYSPEQLELFRAAGVI